MQAMQPLNSRIPQNPHKKDLIIIPLKNPVIDLVFFHLMNMYNTNASSPYLIRARAFLLIWHDA